MSDLSSSGFVTESGLRSGGVDRLNTRTPGAPGEAAGAERPRRELDSVSFSREARAASGLENRPDSSFRADLVSRVRRQLDDRTYFSDEKLDSAVTRLIDDVLGT
jgi:hypothetical protein